MLIVLLLPCRLFEPKISWWVALKSLSALRSSALPRRVGCLALAEVVPRENRRGVCVTWCETLTSGIALRGDFETQNSSGRIREWHESLLLAALVDLKPQESACAFDSVAWWGFADVVVAQGGNSITKSLGIETAWPRAQEGDERREPKQQGQGQGQGQGGGQQGGGIGNNSARRQHQPAEAQDAAATP